MSGARCAERASEAGARGRTNKIAGVLITAIPFGSAARRCSWENGIFCYQMTVRFEISSLKMMGQETDHLLAANEKFNIGSMSKTEILGELSKLTKIERQQIRLRLAELDGED